MLPQLLLLFRLTDFTTLLLVFWIDRFLIVLVFLCFYPLVHSSWWLHWIQLLCLLFLILYFYLLEGNFFLMFFLLLISDCKIFCSHGSSDWKVLVTALGNDSPKTSMNFCSFGELRLLMSVNVSTSLCGVAPVPGYILLKFIFLFLLYFMFPLLFCLYLLQFPSQYHLISGFTWLSFSVFFEFPFNVLLSVTLLISLSTFCQSLVLLLLPVSFTVSLFCEHSLSLCINSLQVGLAFREYR